MKQGLVIKNVTVGNLRTSLRFEPETWEALDEICAREGLNLPSAVHSYR